MSCHYRHCLPPGFVLRKDLTKEQEENKISIEEEIDNERDKVERASGTMITLERFLKWKEQRRVRKEKEEEIKVKEEIKKAQSKGKQHLISGRALFAYDPMLF